LQKPKSAPFANAAALMSSTTDMKCLNFPPLSGTPETVRFTQTTAILSDISFLHRIRFEAAVAHPVGLCQVGGEIIRVRDFLEGELE
jgi:hypothetical protein